MSKWRDVKQNRVEKNIPKKSFTLIFKFCINSKKV